MQMAGHARLSARFRLQSRIAREIGREGEVCRMVHTDFKFHPRITQIGCYWGNGGHTELYLLEGDRLAIVDTGVFDTPERFLVPALNAIGRELSDIDVVINTHGHHDHAGGNGAVVQISDAEVWLPEEDVAIALSVDEQFETYFADDFRLLGREDLLEEEVDRLRTNMGEPFEVARRLQHGDQLDLGKGLLFTVIQTPGHTPGSYSFYLEREGLLIAGDALPGAGSRIGNLPLIYYPDLYETALDRIEALDLNVLCLGHHYRSLSLTRESVKWGRDGKRYLRECREVNELIGAAMEAAVLAGYAAFLPAARSATHALAGPLSLVIDPETGLAHSAGVASLHAHWQRLQG